MSLYEKEVSMKVYYVENQQNKEIRKFSVETQLAANYEYVLGKIRQVFTNLLRKDLDLFYKDKENDFISISSDIELQQAFESVDNGCLKLYVKKKLTKPAQSNKEHIGVTCDGCNSKIYGNRFKCTQCFDFDLCSLCYKKGEHPSDHEMLVIKEPRSSKHMYYSQFPFSHCWERYARTNMSNSCSNKNASNNEENKPTASDQKFDHSQFQKIENNFKEIIKIFESMLGIKIDFYIESCQEKSDKVEKKEDFSEKLDSLIKVINERFGVPTEQMHTLVDDFIKQCDLKSNGTNSDKDINNSNNQVFRNNGDMNQANLSDKKDVSLENQLIEKDKEIVNPSDSLCHTNVESVPHLDPNNVSEVIKEQINPLDTLCPQTSDLQVDSSQEGLGNLIGHLYPQLETQQPSINPANDFIFVDKESIDHKESKLERSLRQMEAMGFDNEGGWLRQLLISKECSIDKVLDALTPAK
ncbi:sequestosome-1 [Hydra vulgaris]|uniref:sequestosome-1 n=1 Tax=Hydra vulgaris TaxID=6087 RepID=UPI001F5E7881|nr:sequestosome-1 [Hydra vulgaris]